MDSYSIYSFLLDVGAEDTKTAELTSGEGCGTAKTSPGVKIWDRGIEKRLVILRE